MDSDKFAPPNDTDPMRDIVAVAAANALSAGPEMRQRLLSWRRLLRQSDVWSPVACRDCLFDLSREVADIAFKGYCPTHGNLSGIEAAE